MSQHQTNATSSPPQQPTPPPILSRSLFLRLLGLCHVAIGLSSLRFARVLYGTYGLQPLSAQNINLNSFVPFFWMFVGFENNNDEAYNNNNNNNNNPFISLSIDRILELSSFLSIVLGLILLSDAAICHAFIPLILYLLQTSFVNAPTPYVTNYGWEWQLSEASLLAVFVCPLFERPTKRSIQFMKNRGEKNDNIHCKIYNLVYPWLIRLAAFRVMWGAGMSKLGKNSSDCWSYSGNFSCTTTHYETMPLPNPLAFVFHHLPFRFHQFEVLMNHFVELVCPYGLIFFLSWRGLLARRIRTFSALASILYMMAIISTGTYSIINWVTMVFLVGSLDEQFLSWLLPVRMQKGTEEEEGREMDKRRKDRTSDKKEHLSDDDTETTPSPPVALSTPRHIPTLSRLEKIGAICSSLLRCAFVVLVLIKTRHPIAESLSESPWLKQFDEYHIAPAYGVFGFVNKIRLSPVIETIRLVDPSIPSSSAVIAAEEQGKQWEELELNCLPGKVDSVPCIPPFPGYHYRLDWDVWIQVTASLEHPYSDRRRFVPKSLAIALSRLLLEEDGDQMNQKGGYDDEDVAIVKDVDVRSLFRNPPEKTPTHIRVSLRQYEYVDIMTLLRTGRWWQRSLVSGNGGGNHPIMVDRAMARRVVGDPGRQQQQQQSRFPPPLEDIPHPQRDTLLIIIATNLVIGLIKSSVVAVLLSILSFLFQWQNVKNISMIGILLGLGSLVVLIKNNERRSRVDTKPANRRK